MSIKFSNNSVEGENAMTAINGTAGYDYLTVQGAGDYEVFGGDGDDLIGIHKQSYHSGTVTVDGGAGADRIVIQDYGDHVLIVHGGVGNDTLDLVSGGLVYGDAGADIFSINGSAGGRPFVIADFASEDRIDMTPFLKVATAWIESTNPFTTNFARLAQLGADTVLQINRGVGGWSTLGSIKGVVATSLTSAQLGFAPKIETLAFASLAVSPTPALEGSKVSLDITLSAPTTQTASFYLTINGKGPGSTSLANVSLSIAAGQTKASYAFNAYDDSTAGTGSYEISFSATGVAVDPRAGAGSQTIEVRDNDVNGFSVYAASATSAYKHLTALGAVRSQDTQAVSALDVNLASRSSRGLVQAIEPFAASTTSVAMLSYEFFTGKTPSQAGIDFLVSPTGPNTTNLNSAYYGQFDTINRFINFAVNLGKNGEAKDNFTAKYGALSLFDVTRDAYKAIFGVTPTDEKLHALLDGRTDYLAYYGGDGSAGIGTKAAMVGFLLAAAATENTGTYARALENFYIDLADGSAQFHVDLIGVYGPGTFLDSMT